MKKKTFKEVFGKNPWDPWSAKAGLAETSAGQLNKYLLARGINPKYVAKDTKIAHSKSNQFKQWAMSHQREEVELDEDMGLTSIDSKTQARKGDIHSSQHKHKEIKTPRGPGSHHEEISQAKVNKFHAKLDNLVHSTFGKRKNEEVELDEAKVKPMPKVKIKEPIPSAAERLHAQHQKVRKDMGLPDPSEYKKKLAKITGESVLHDEPEGTLTRVAEKKLSKGAQLLKSVYMKKKMVKEDLYDTEKDDKNPAKVHGKAPKLEKADEKESKGEQKPQAAATLSGGTTLTKQPRDTVELDPMMRNRPGQPDITKKDDKKKDDKKDGKKEDKKSDK